MESKISSGIRRNVYIIRLLILVGIMYICRDYIIDKYSSLIFYGNRTGILFLSNAYINTFSTNNFTNYYNWSGILFLNQTTVVGHASSHYLYFGTIEQFISEKLLANISF